MANPNIIDVVAIRGNTAVSNVTTIFSNVLTNSIDSGTVIKLNSLTVSNYTVNNIRTTVKLNRSLDYFLVGNVTIPAFSTLVVIGKDTGIYLIEGDVLQANASANVAASLIASYEVIT